MRKTARGTPVVATFESGERGNPVHDGANRVPHLTSKGHISPGTSAGAPLSPALDVAHF